MGKVITLKQARYEKKNRYIEYDLNKLNSQIYNDLPITFSDKAFDYDRLLDKMMYEGETYDIIPSTSNYHYVTSFGRVINAKQMKEITLHVSHSRLAFYIDKTRNLLKTHMDYCNFNYDYDKHIEFYKKTNYPIRNNKYE